MMPIVDGLSKEFEGVVDVVRLNAGQEENARLQGVWGLRGHPSFVLLDEEDHLVSQLFGPQAEAVLRKAMESVSDR